MDLETLSSATSQEVFDHVAAHLLKQRKRSFLERKDVYGCNYHLGELRCAAGCLIAKHQYKSSFEGYDWLELVRHDAVPVAHSELIFELQGVHDIYEPESWHLELERLAERLGLKPPTL